jgi:hypothetical protein
MDKNRKDIANFQIIPANEQRNEYQQQRQKYTGKRKDSFLIAFAQHIYLRFI